MRTCTGCRGKRVKNRLIRVAQAGDGTVSVDLTRSTPGRGAYVCFDEDCVDRACRSGSLARALRFGGAVPDGLRDELMAMTKGIDG
ncbi:MAG: YlxR family protein [Actinomycetota bacterium]|nr:YlxR family protein [Actinomycetota bacterium]